MVSCLNELVGRVGSHRASKPIDGDGSWKEVIQVVLLKASGILNRNQKLFLIVEISFCSWWHNLQVLLHRSLMFTETDMFLERMKYIFLFNNEFTNFKQACKLHFLPIQQSNLCFKNNMLSYGVGKPAPLDVFLHSLLLQYRFIEYVQELRQEAVNSQSFCVL